MNFFEIKGDIVSINIDTNVIRKYNKKIIKKQILDYGDSNEFLIEKLINGNKEAIMKSIDIVKNILLETGCSNYKQLYEKMKKEGKQ